VERRRGPRLALDAAAVIRIESLNAPFNSRIVNASLNGLLLAIPAPRPVGTRMHITVRIAEPASEISVSGIVVHVAESPQAAPGFTSRVGIFLTDTGPEWESLCQRLATAASAAAGSAAPS
jgi:hypothetical protein